MDSKKTKNELIEIKHLLRCILERITLFFNDKITLEDIKSINLTALEASPRLNNIFKKLKVDHNIVTLEDISHLTEQDLLKIDNLGKSTLKELCNLVRPFEDIYCGIYFKFLPEVKEIKIMVEKDTAFLKKIYGTKNNLKKTYGNEEPEEGYPPF